MKPEAKELLTKTINRLKPKRVWPKITLTIVGLLVALAIIIFLSASVYREVFRGKVYPGVYVGNYPVGGLTASQVKNFIENLNNRLAKEGILLSVVDATGQKHEVKLNTVIATDNTVELVRLDSDAVATLTMNIGRTGHFWRSLLFPLWLRVGDSVDLATPVVISDKALNEGLKDSLGSFEEEAHNAALSFTGESLNNYTVVPEQAGHIFNYYDIISTIKGQLETLSFDPIVLRTKLFKPSVTVGDVKSILPSLPLVLGDGELGINYVDPQTKFRRDWNLTPLELARSLAVVKDNDGAFIFSLAKLPLVNYLNDNIRRYVDSEAQDAKFVMADNKVKEFQASRSGLSLNTDKTYDDLNAAFIERNYHPASLTKTVSLSADVVDPAVKTAAVNNLGITDVLGVGFSTFHDSHTNRIKNIAHAVDRLNGVLIKPGEEFSALKYAGPFTAQNGFLPEQVIKGKEIKPEIGGGMCQIGTTLFRMAMNSGMDITARRNHSLVVGYYADPVNGNPGTDATLYEPSLDLKFINDTGSYLLLQTDINYKKQQLTFTLWGQPDGRKGWYSHPVVSKWIPAGDPEQIIETDGKLKPGEQKCQGAFRGAVASFIYTRVTSSSQKIDREFTSYYRPLPKICMVGANPDGSTSTPAGAPVDLGEPAQ